MAVQVRPGSSPGGLQRSMTALLFVALLLIPAAAAAPLTFERRYEAATTVVTGDPSGYAFTGTMACNRDTDTVADTGACFPLIWGPYDFHGRDFRAILRDDVFEYATWFVVGIDLTGDGAIQCQNGGGPDRCWLGSGVVEGTIPATTSADMVRVFPATLHMSGTPCCPTAGATKGRVTMTFL